jgi:hypothetical protein
MARRIINRKEKRAEHDAYERTAKEDEDQEEEEEEEGDEEAEEEADAGGEAGDDDEDAEAEGDGDDEDAPKKKKKKKEPKPKVVKAKPKTRTRTAKVVRMKVVWAVYNNSNQQVKTFEYPDRKSADEYAAKMRTDKKTTYFVQPFKKPIEEKKEE